MIKDLVILVKSRLFYYTSKYEETIIPPKTIPSSFTQQSFVGLKFTFEYPNMGLARMVYFPSRKSYIPTL